MHDYQSLKDNHGKEISQTIDSPILIFDYFDLNEAVAVCFAILVVGVIFNLWMIAFIIVLVVLIAGPIIRKRNEKGIHFHFPYRKWGMNLPGLINPKKRQKFSD